jgi:hypothetical protein
VARARDAQQPTVDEAFGKSNNLRGASVEIQFPVLRRFGALEECDPRGGWRGLVRHGD